MMSSITLVVFQHSGYGFAVEVRYVVAMGTFEDVAHNQQKNIDLSGLFTATPEIAPTANYALRLRGQQNELLLALEQEAQIIELNADSIWPLPPLMQHAKQHPSIQALAWHHNQLLTLLNVQQLTAL